MSLHQENRPGWRRPGLVLFCAGLIALCGCKREPERQQEIRQVELEAAPVSEAQLARLAGDLLSLQEQIREAPASIELRKRLLALALDEENKSFRAVGFGLIPENPESRETVQKSTERAALLDGCRWLAYLRAWRKDIKKPDFGAIRGEVPPAKTIYQHTSVDQVVMIVETEAE
jgi:hypothetical protein